MLRKMVALVLCLVLAAGFVPGITGLPGAKAGQMQLTPLDETDDIYGYEKDFGNSGLKLMIPYPYVQSAPIQNGEKLTQMAFLTEDGTEKPFFVISGTKLPSESPKELKDMGWEDLGPLFELIVQDTAAPQMEYLEDYVDGLPGMRLTFRGENSGRHLVGIREG